MQKLLSIIVPVYNAQNYIHRCIESVLKQSYKTIELVLVDDGSTDDSAKICDEYQEQYKYIKVIHKGNDGPNIARQMGCKISTGEYIAFLDADDYVEPYIYTSLIETLENEKADIVQCGYNIVECDGQLKAANIIEKCIINGKLESSIYLRKSKNDYLWDKVFRKNLFKDVEFVKLRGGEDACLLIQLFGKANKIVTIKECLYNYVMTKDSLCRKPFSYYHLDNVKAGEFIYSYYEKNFPQLIGIAASRICSNAAQLYFLVGKSELSDKKEIRKSLVNHFKKYYAGTRTDIARKTDTKFRRYAIKLFNISPSLYCTILKRL